MVFRRRRMSAPVKSDKHEITWSNLAQNASTVQKIVIAQPVKTADKDTATEVEIGSHIYGGYLEFHFSAQVTTNPKVIHWEISLDHPGQTDVSPALYYQSIRSQIIKRGMEMLPSATSTVFKRIVPFQVFKKFQRMTEGTVLSFRYICSSTETINACGIGIYKEFY